MNSRLDLPNVQHAEPHLWTGGQVSIRDLERLKTLGVTLAIDVRGRGEPQPFHPPTAFEAQGIDYRQIPVESAADLSPDNAKLLGDALASAEGAVVVYCASGNRVGALFACLAKWRDGAPLEEAIAIGNARGLNQMEPIVRHLLTLTP